MGVHDYRTGYLKRKSYLSSWSQYSHLTRLLQKVIPIEDLSESRGNSTSAQEQSFIERPNFNISTMSANFRRFNSRIGVVFVFQARLIRLLSWTTPSQTLSLLAVYTLVCLDPYLISILPLITLLLGLLIPAFVTRHPAPPTTLSAPAFEYSPGGPPLAPAATVRPVKELSKDFFRNMRDLQNCMEDFSRAHDKIVSTIAPPTNFSNEPLSSAIFLVLTFSCAALFLGSHLIPWRPIVLAGGWLAICSGHPEAQRSLHKFHKQQIRPQQKKAQTLIDRWIERDIVMDGAPEVREVEIFELQKKSNGGEWESWVFTPDPWDVGSQARIRGDKVTGSRFFEDVRAPRGWMWSESKWSLDLWSREWVEERCITGVEVETEGERWVWDLVVEKDGREELESLLGTSPSKKSKAKTKVGPSWEEATGAFGRRGDWRRRRWTRMVKRREMTVAD